MPGYERVMAAPTKTARMTPAAMLAKNARLSFMADTWEAYELFLMCRRPILTSGRLVACLSAGPGTPDSQAFVPKNCTRADAKDQRKGVQVLSIFDDVKNRESGEETRIEAQPGEDESTYLDERG